VPWVKWTEENRVTLPAGENYRDDTINVIFAAIERNGEMYIDIENSALSKRNVFSLTDTSWEIQDSPLYGEPPSQQTPLDIDLHAYTNDGREIGMDYSTGEYKVEIPDARTSFNIRGGGPEWISLSEGENAYFVIDPTPLREWANEVGVSVDNVTATWDVIHYDEESVRTESEPVTIDINLEEPSILGVPASIDIDPNTLNMKSNEQWITCYVELPQGYDVNNINLNTVLLNKAVYAENNPKYGFVKNPEITDRDKDGLPELMVKFDKAALQAKIQSGDSVTVPLTGNVIKDGIPIPFQGTDIVDVILLRK
jgi:hypothetical protein